MLINGKEITKISTLAEYAAAHRLKVKYAAARYVGVNTWALDELLPTVPKKIEVWYDLATNTEELNKLRPECDFCRKFCTFSLELEEWKCLVSSRCISTCIMSPSQVKLAKTVVELRNVYEKLFDAKPKGSLRMTLSGEVERERKMLASSVREPEDSSTATRNATAPVPTPSNILTGDALLEAAKAAGYVWVGDTYQEDIKNLQINLATHELVAVGQRVVPGALFYDSSKRGRSFTQKCPIDSTFLVVQPRQVKMSTDPIDAAPSTIVQGEELKKLVIAAGYEARGFDAFGSLDTSKFELVPIGETVPVGTRMLGAEEYLTSTSEVRAMEFHIPWIREKKADVVETINATEDADEVAKTLTTSPTTPPSTSPTTKEAPKDEILVDGVWYKLIKVGEEVKEGDVFGDETWVTEYASGTVPFILPKALSGDRPSYRPFAKALPAGTILRIGDFIDCYREGNWDEVTGLLGARVDTASLYRRPLTSPYMRELDMPKVAEVPAMSVANETSAVDTKEYLEDGVYYRPLLKDEEIVKGDEYRSPDGIVWRLSGNYNHGKQNADLFKYRRPIAVSIPSDTKVEVGDYVMDHGFGWIESENYEGGPTYSNGRQLESLPYRRPLKSGQSISEARHSFEPFAATAATKIESASIMPRPTSNILRGQALLDAAKEAGYIIDSWSLNYQERLLAGDGVDLTRYRLVHPNEHCSSSLWYDVDYGLRSGGSLCPPAGNAPHFVKIFDSALSHTLSDTDATRFPQPPTLAETGTNLATLDNSTQPKETEIMTANKDNKLDTGSPKTLAKKSLDALASTGSVMVDAAMDAGKAAAAAKMSEGLVLIAKAQLGDNWPKALNSPLGMAFAKLLVPGLVAVSAEMFKEKLPVAGLIGNAAQTAIRGTVQEVTTGFIGAASSFLPQLIELASGLPAGELYSGDSDVEEDVKID